MNICLVLLFLATESFGEDSPMFRANEQHSGVYAATGVPNFNKVKWQFHTAGQVISSPAVVGGIIYIGCTDGNLYAVDREAGTQIWKFDAKNRITSSPAVSDGVVYFGAYNGVFYAISASRGQLRWKFETGGERRFSAKHLHGSQPAAKPRPTRGIAIFPPRLFPGARSTSAAATATSTP